MLGRLRMSTTEALEKYNGIAGRIFSEKNMKWKTQEGKFKATTLEQEMKSIVASKLKERDEDARMFDPELAGSGRKGATYVAHPILLCKSKFYAAGLYAQCPPTASGTLVDFVPIKSEIIQALTA
jgi:hypothetical protein